ncbi:hypothetical protein D3C71_821210 [compost metagenome]
MRGGIAHGHGRHSIEAAQVSCTCAASNFKDLRDIARYLEVVVQFQRNAAVIAVEVAAGRGGVVRVFKGDRAGTRWV